MKQTKPEGKYPCQKCTKKTKHWYYFYDENDKLFKVCEKCFGILTDNWNSIKL